MPGLSVPHHLLKFAQVHVHCIGDAIQSSHLYTYIYIKIMVKTFVSIKENCILSKFLSQKRNQIYNVILYIVRSLDYDVSMVQLLSILAK